MRALRWERERSGPPTTLPFGVFGLVLSILLVVLVSGAVLWVVDGEHRKPTSEPAELPSGGMHPVVDPAVDVVLATIPRAPAAPVRQRASSRRIAPVPDVPPPEPQWRDPPVAAPAPAIAALPAVRTLDPPVPRHRLRSALLLVVLVIGVGALLAAVIGVVVTALALALRAAVTS